ncbi:MAG: penicillin acylase family protein [Bacteroidia bacterium]|nr:penicillin acylase family protein [Bacteroidia bacterium]
MAQYIKFFSWTVLSIIIAYLFHCGFKTGDQKIPGFGKLLNPTSGLWKNAENDARFKDKRIAVKGLDGDIQISFDTRLVPHVFANSTRDALFAQGYVEAYHRLWQMDFICREAGGTLSEVIGEKTHRYDIRRRKEGLLYGAELTVSQWQKQTETIGYIQSYLDGVNHHISHLKKKDWPIEFKLLGYSPSEWTMLHSALILKTMTSTLASYNEDIRATNMMLEIGIDSFNSLYPVFDPNQSPVIHDSGKLQFDQLQKRERNGKGHYQGERLENLSVYSGIEGVGSNNWAVNAAKTSGSHPILCNDPHLNLTLPSIWYEIHIVTPEFNAYGVSIPGMPGIMIGMNEDIAWGLTNAGHDFVDYYTIDWKDNTKEKYIVDGQEKTVKLREETIKVKGSKDIIFNMKMTEFGPVFYESENDNTPDITRDWIGYHEHDRKESSVFVNIMKSSNYQEFKTASNEFFSPAQNFLFASKEDTVALRVNGNLPLKYNNEGRFVKKGNSLKNKTTSYIPRDYNPESINPERGFVSSANQVSTGMDYPYFYSGNFEEYRGKRVNEILEEKENLTAEDMKAMQLDVYSLKAAEFLPVFLEGVKDVSIQNETQRTILDELRKWDFNYDKDNIASKFFEHWFNEYKTMFWNNYFDNKSLQKILYPEDWMLVQKGKDNPGVNKEMIQLAYERLWKKFEGWDSLDQPWKHFRPKSINHLLDIPAFSHQVLDIGGCGDVLNAISSYIGPSWRMIVELDDETKAHAVFPGGQSGSPSSRFYDDSMDEWINGNYHEITLPKTPGEVSDKALYSITLKTVK